MLPIAQYLNNARGQVSGLAKTIGNRFNQPNDKLSMLNQAIMQKGINGLNPEEKQLFQSWYMNPTMGATTAPLAGKNVFRKVIRRGDIELAKRMASRGEFLIPQSLEDVGNALKILPQHLNIPKNILGKMDINQILNEFLPLVQAEREPVAKGIFRIINLLAGR